MAKFVIGFLIIFIVFACTSEETKIRPTKTTIVESVYASATIQPDSLYQVYAIVSGIIDANLVSEGDMVQKDTPLVQIINSNPKLNAENSRLALDLAVANSSGSTDVLKSIQDEIDAATLQMQDDSLQFSRQQNLWNQQIGSKATFESKKLKYALSQRTLSLLKSNYVRTKKELQTQLQQAENSYQVSLLNTKDFTVKSKLNGKVYALYKNPGEIVNGTTPIAAVGHAEVFVVELLVDEVDIVRIHEGQEVLVTLDAYKDEVFKANVRKIFPSKDERNQTFLVEALFVNPPPQLYPGLSGEANIIIAKKEETLTIPKRYLMDGDRVRTADGIISVEVGLSNLEAVEITSGITSETYIYLPAND